jgi:hypothetical protein
MSGIYILFVKKINGYKGQEKARETRKLEK